MRIILRFAFPFALGLLWLLGGISCTGRVRLECKEDAECPKERPFCVGALCKQCVRDADCQSGLVCRTGACVTGKGEGDLEIIASSEEVGDGGEVSLPEAEPNIPETEPLPEFDPTEEVCEAGGSRACYRGLAKNRGVGACVEGVQRCHGTGRWLVCEGDQLPVMERCDDAVDSNCDGRTDEACCLPVPERLKSVDVAHRNSLILRMIFAKSGLLFSSSSGEVAAWSQTLEAKPLRSWNPAKGVTPLPPISALALSQDETLLATGDYSSRVKVWEAATGKELKELVDPTTPNKTAHAGSVQVAVFAENNTLLTAGDDSAIRVWEGDTGNLKGTLKGHTGQVYSLVLLKGKNELYSGDSDGFVFRWKLDEANAKHSLVKDRMGIVWGLDLHSKKALLAMGGDKLVVKDLDGVETDRTLISPADGLGSIRRVAFSPNGAWLAASTNNNQVHLWDTATWSKQTTVLENISGGASGNVLSLAWSHDSLRLAAGAFQAIRVWSCPAP